MFNPVNLLLQLLLVVALLGGNYALVKWFFGSLEPAARSATEQRFDVRLERNILGWWTVAPAPGEQASPGAGVGFKVFVLNFALLLALVLVFVLEIVLLALLSIKLFRGSWEG